MYNGCRETRSKEDKYADHNLVLYPERRNIHRVDETNGIFACFKANFQLRFTGNEREVTESKAAKYQSSKLNSNRNLKNCNFDFAKHKTITVLSLKNISHLSLDSPGNFWASDEKGNLIHFDVHGNPFHKLSTCESKNGYHTVTREGNLLYADRYMQTVYTFTGNRGQNSPMSLFTIEEWWPWCINTSMTNEGVLLGMKRGSEWKISSYSKEGKKILDIQKDIRGRKLYQSISYVTENINGDICSSDYLASKVIVVNGCGYYQFSYCGHNSEGVFTPYGICTDAKGHILVCSSVYCGYVSHGVHLLAHDGQFLTLLPLSGGCPRAIGVDNQHRIYIATERSTITVYKYIQNTDT